MQSKSFKKSLHEVKVPTHLSPSLSNADPVYLVQSVASNGQYGNARVQPIMIRKLAGMLLHPSVVLIHKSASL